MTQRTCLTSSDSSQENCEWEFLFFDGHKVEYWYKCKVCGKKDWFARNDKPK